MPRQHSWRYFFSAAVFGLVGVLIFWRAFALQTGAQAEAFIDQSKFYSRLYTTIYPPRGEIYDRNGNLLAGNRTVYEIGVNLASLRGEAPKAIALALGSLVGADYNRVLELIVYGQENGLVYVVLADYILPEKVNLLRNYNAEREPSEGRACSNDPALIALECRQHLARSYPEFDLASNVLGFVNQDNYGNFGVEQQYQDLLAGVPESIWVPTDPNQAEVLPNIPGGASLVLTLDREIQTMVEDVLDEHILLSGAESATAIVMDPRNGEILAMTSTPRLDLNNYQTYTELYDGDRPYNRAVGQVYEPGSIFKVITVAAAFDMGVSHPEQVYPDKGVFSHGGITVRNWNGAAWGDQTILGCMQHSLNVCLADLAVNKVGADKFYEYVEAFGFGRPTGVDMANEQLGSLRTPAIAGWYPSDLVTNSFGQGLAVTPLQMVMSVSAFVNDGKMAIPHIVKAVVQDGSQYSLSPQYAGAPISAETARTMTSMLADSLEYESSLAMVPGYRLAGKTGTAQIPTPNGTYDPNQTNTSFIGWGPVDDPRFIVFVWIERPESSIWASEVAAPAFADIVERLVVLMNIPPDNQRLAQGQGD
ncbi:MAG: penicillin-binding protein 2 [Anaerolineales bacterium]|nr:penicillin-binding protein 2 [Anaerolineales bacterium]MCW5856388.1 penicillin-binding protein 2 [Anaerolineales bacterium]